MKEITVICDVCGEKIAKQDYYEVVISDNRNVLIRRATQKKKSNSFDVCSLKCIYNLMVNKMLNAEEGLVDYSKLP